MAGSGCRRGWRVSARMESRVKRGRWVGEEFSIFSCCFKRLLRRSGVVRLS